MKSSIKQAADFHPLVPGPWALWAEQRIGDNSEVTYHHVGSRDWTGLFGSHEPTCPVWVEEDAEGEYWGWMDSSVDHAYPHMIWQAELLLEMCFAGGSKACQTALEDRGHIGRIVRLNIRLRSDPDIAPRS